MTDTFRSPAVVRGSRPKLHAPQYRETPLVSGALPQTFCGPAALSAITGMTAECGAAWINVRRGVPLHYRVRSSVDEEIRFALENTGWRLRMVPRSAVSEFAHFPPSLAAFLRGRREPFGTALLLLTVGHHYVVVAGRRIADNQQGLVGIGASHHRRKRVRRCYVVEPMEGEGPAQIRRMRTDSMPASYRPRFIRIGTGYRVADPD